MGKHPDFRGYLIGYHKETLKPMRMDDVDRNIGAKYIGYEISAEQNIAYEPTGEGKYIW